MKDKNLFSYSLMVGALLIACGSDSKMEPVNLPEVRLVDATIVEGSSGTSLLEFQISLSQASSETVTFNISTEDGSAKAGTDYEEVLGAPITIMPGQLTQTFQVSVISDTDLELTEQFKLKLSNVQNATLFSETYNATITDDDSYQPELAADGFITPATYPNMELFWADEFEGPTLNTEDWNYEIGNGCNQDLCGWGNNELQSYTDSEDNIFIRDGALVIKATDDNSYESGRLTTQNKQLFNYGRIDIRAKLPEGQGIWPALWMLGVNITEVGWPKCGEIDIMEMVGHQSDRVYGTTHYDAGGYQTKGENKVAPNGQSFQQQYHIYTLIWQENKIEWLIDYQKYFTFTSAQANGGYPFNDDFFLILNLAVGGNWPGAPDATTIFPQEMVVDYIRVFQ